MAKQTGMGGMSKAEAVRRAIADLGPDAKPARLQAHIRDKYGIEMTGGHVKVEKQKYFKRLRKSGEAPAGKTRPKAASRRAPAGGISKAEAVRRALADLGPDAKPTQLHGHIRTRYGLEMSLDHISVEKRKALLRMAGERKPAAAEPSTQPSAARTAGAPGPHARAASEANGIALDDLATVKALVERVGANTLQQVIEMMAQ
jgi:hypothetical protein